MVARNFAGCAVSLLSRLALRFPSATILFSFTSFTDSTAISAQANTAFSAISTACKSNNQPIEVSKMFLLSCVPPSFCGTPPCLTPLQKRKRHGLCAPRTGHVSIPIHIFISRSPRARVAAACVHPVTEPPHSVKSIAPLYRLPPHLSTYSCPQGVKAPALPATPPCAAAPIPV